MGRREIQNTTKYECGGNVDFFHVIFFRVKIGSRSKLKEGDKVMSHWHRNVTGETTKVTKDIQKQKNTIHEDTQLRSVSITIKSNVLKLV